MHLFTLKLWLDDLDVSFLIDRLIFLSNHFGLDRQYRSTSSPGGLVGLSHDQSGGHWCQSPGKTGPCYLGWSVQTKTTWGLSKIIWYPHKTIRGKSPVVYSLALFGCILSMFMGGIWITTLTCQVWVIWTNFPSNWLLWSRQNDHVLAPVFFPQNGSFELRFSLRHLIFVCAILLLELEVWVFFTWFGDMSIELLESTFLHCFPGW